MKGDICRIDGCESTLKYRGTVCQRCRYLKRVYGSFTHKTEVKTKLDHCDIKGCDNPLTKGKVKCNMHRHLKERYGSYDYKVKSSLEIFWSKVNKTASCWLWTGSLNADGYGATSLIKASTKNTRVPSVHRVSWELHNNPIPDGLCVLHKCDVRNCINPKHLFLGSHKDNMQDMARKGRGVGSTLKGDKCGASKLKEAEVKDIKALINDGYSDAAIAIKYNVIRQTINMIRNSKTWKHIK